MKIVVRLVAVVILVIGLFHLAMGWLPRTAFSLLEFSVSDSLPIVFLLLGLSLISLRFILPFGLICGGTGLLFLKRWARIVLLVVAVSGLVATLFIGSVGENQSGSWFKPFDLKTESLEINIFLSGASYLFAMWCVLIIVTLLIPHVRRRLS